MDFPVAASNTQSFVAPTAGLLDHGSGHHPNYTAWLIDFSAKSQTTQSDSVIIQAIISIGASALICLFWIFQHSWDKTFLNPRGALENKQLLQSKGRPGFKLGDIGLDSTAYLIFNKLCVYTSCATAPPALYLLWMDYQYKVGRQDLTELTWSTVLSMDGVSEQLIWWHYAFACYTSLSTCLMSYICVKQMIRKREVYFAEEEVTPTHILLTGGLDQWEKLLTRDGVWRIKLPPGMKLDKRHILTHQINQLVPRLEETGVAYCSQVDFAGMATSPAVKQQHHAEAQQQLDAFMKIVDILNNAHNSYTRLLRRANRRARRCSACCCFCCFGNHKIKEYRDIQICQPHPTAQSRNFGFICYRRHSYARFHTRRLLLAHRPWWERFLKLLYKANVEMAPDLDAMCFFGINRHRAVRWSDTTRSLFFMILAISAYALIVILISGLANLVNYLPKVAFLRSIWDWQVHGKSVGRDILTGFVGFVPPALSFGAKFGLIPVMKRFAYTRGASTFTARDQMVLRWYFGTLLICHLTLFTFLGVMQSLVQTVWTAWVQNGMKDEWKMWEAILQFPQQAYRAMAGSSNYWLSWLCLQCVFATIDIIQPARIWTYKILPAFRRRFRRQTLREVKLAAEPPKADITVIKNSANLLLIQAVIATYAMCCPLICILGLFANVVHWLTVSEQLYKVHKTVGEGQGHLFWLFIERMLICAGIVLPCSVALGMIVHFGWIGVAFSLIPATVVGLFAAQVCHNGIWNFLYRKTFTWCLRDDYQYGHLVYEIEKELDRGQRSKRFLLGQLRAQGIDVAEDELRRVIAQGSSSAEEKYKSLFDDEGNRNNIETIAAVIALEEKLQPIDPAQLVEPLTPVLPPETSTFSIRNRWKRRRQLRKAREMKPTAPYPVPQPPNLLRRPVGLEECQRRVDRHKSLKKCQRECWVNVWCVICPQETYVIVIKPREIQPTFTSADFDILEDAFRNVQFDTSFASTKDFLKKFKLAQSVKDDDILNVVRAKKCATDQFGSDLEAGSNWEEIGSINTHTIRNWSD